MMIISVLLAHPIRIFTFGKLCELLQDLKRAVIFKALLRVKDKQVKPHQK